MYMAHVCFYIGCSDCVGYVGGDNKMRIYRHINAFFKRLYQCQSKIFSTLLSKITKYNRVLSVARLLGHDPTPRPTWNICCVAAVVKYNGFFCALEC